MTGILSSLTAFFQAAAAACKAWPIFLAWKITGECEQLTQDIILNENRGTPSGKSRADELRIALAYRRKLHDALLPANTSPESGHGDREPVRAVPVPD